MAEKQHTPEEKIKKAKAICEAYACGHLTIASCAENQSIDPRTFNDWIRSVPEISDMYKQAKAQADEASRGSLTAKCMTSLEKLITGYEVEETQQDGVIQYDADGNQIGIKVKNIRRMKKHIQPHVTAIIFALKSLDPARFKDNMPPHQAAEQVFLIGGKEVKF